MNHLKTQEPCKHIVGIKQEFDPTLNDSLIVFVNKPEEARILFKYCPNCGVKNRLTEVERFNYNLQEDSRCIGEN